MDSHGAAPRGAGRKSKSTKSSTRKAKSAPKRTTIEALEPRVMLSAVDSARPHLLTSLPAGLTAGPQLANVTWDLIVVDPRLAAEGLVPASSSPTTRVVLLNTDSDVLDQIGQALRETGNVRTLHLITHGASGSITVGDQVVDGQTLAQRAGEVSGWAQSMTADGVIAVYGCDVAAGESGRAFVQTLAKRSGATVAASTDVTGAARRGGDWQLEYVAGNDRVQSLQFGAFDGLLATFTVAPSGGITTHVVGMGATAVDSGVVVTSSDGAATYTSAVVTISAGFRTGEDVLALPSPPAGFVPTFSAVTGALTLTAAGGKTAAEFQAALRLVTYRNTQTSFANISGRGITFEFQSITSAAKGVQPDLPVDGQIQDKIEDAFGVIDQIGLAIVNANAQPQLNVTTDVPIVGERIHDLLYPNSSTLDGNGNAVADYSKSIQPAQIGSYLRLKQTVVNYFASAGTITNLNGLDAALEAQLNSVVLGNKALIQVDAAFTKPAATDARRIDITVTILTAKGESRKLALEQIERDLNVRFGDNAKVTVGGGADIAFTVSLDLAGHEYGGVTVVASNKVGVNFTRLNAFAGMVLDPTSFDIDVGAISGTVAGGAGFVGIRIPVNLGANGNTRTLNNWATNGSDYTGFNTMSGSANVSLPISASLGGVAATGPTTKVVLTDANLFDSNGPSYVATDFDKLKYFASIKIDDVLQQILKVGDLYNSLTNSGETLFGVDVPFLDRTSLGDLFDFGSLFDDAIGSKIDLYEPILNTPGRDSLVDYRLPLSDDSTPRPSMYSDLRAAFTFGIVINDQWPIKTITVAADAGRIVLQDLVVDINAALTAASVAIVASDVKGKLSLKANSIAIQRFAIVPLTPDAGRLSPTTPPGSLSGLTIGQAQYYTVTGTTTGTVTGTNYYSLASPLGAAAVHAGILTDGQTGVVKVTRVGSVPVLLGSDRHDVVSGTALNTDSYLIETAVSDIRKLGLVNYGDELTVLESFNAGGVRATLPLNANLATSARFLVKSGANTYTVNVPDNDRTTLKDLVSDIQTALTSSGILITNLLAGVVDADGNPFDLLVDTPVVNTDYFLKLYQPETSAWTDFSLAPASDATAHMVLPVGFLSGNTAARPRPAALTTFNDFTNNVLFPGITISPVYNATNGTVTLEFTATDTASPMVKAAFDMTLGKLGRLVAEDDALTLIPSVTNELSFGLQFKIGATSPVSIPSGNTLPSNGRLSGPATFNIDMVLDDDYDVTVPQVWTTANNNVQDLIADINKALTDTTNGAGLSEDITDRFIARRLQDGNQLELLTASRANANVPYVPTHALGVLSADLVLNFWHNGSAYSATVKVADTTANTSFADLVLDMNAALGMATNGAGQLVSLSDQMFFTTIAGASGAANSDAYLYATTPPVNSWPATVVLRGDRTNSFVTQLGYNDSSESTTSTITARAATSSANLVQHSNGKPIAGGTVEMLDVEFAGTIPYGFNKLDFASTTGGVTAKATVNLVNGLTATADQIAGNMAGSLARTLRGANGSGNARAALTLADITSTGGTVDEDAVIDIEIANISSVNVTVAEPLGVPIPIPGQANGKLLEDRTLNFLHDGARYAITITAVSTVNNTTFGQLVAQYKAGLATAQKTVAGVTTTVDARPLFDIVAGAEAGQVVIKVGKVTANPDFAVVELVGDFGEIAAQGTFGLTTVADSLTEVLPLLDAIQSDMDLFSSFKLPLIDLKVNDLIDIKGELLNKIETMRKISISSPSQIAAAVAQGLGIPANYVGVVYDNANSSYRVDIQWEHGVATAKSLDLSLADFYRFTDQEPPAGLTSFNDSGSSSPLDVKIKAITTIALGIDLTDPNSPRTFLYGHDGTADRILSDGDANGTSVELHVEAYADKINFTAALGAFGIFVRDGSARLGGAARTFNGDPIFTFDDKTKQLHYARDNQAAVLSVTLGTIGEKYYIDPTPSDEDAYDTDNYATKFEGTVEANLPLFTPTEFMNPFTNRSLNVRIEGQSGNTTVNPGGNIFQLLIGDLQSYADASLNLTDWQRQISDVFAGAAVDGNGNAVLTNPEEVVVAALEANIEGLKTSDLMAIYTPDVDDANSGVRAPTLLDLVRDPAILVDGVDVALGAIESGLSALDNLNIPVIGSVLGEAVDGVFDWRRGWLLDLKHDLRGQGEAFFETLKDNVYDFLGPAGLDILLKDNGIRSVDGMMQADSKDDITLDFLDADGNKMTGLGGYGAEAMEFKVRLGQVLVNTGADISFNFDALQPAMSLAINGGLTFKLGWDMTIGFGISLEDGFYMVTDSDPSANELELRFEAGLSGRQTGFTVAERPASITGWSVKDAAGSWVLGPRKGNGSADIVDVMPVDINGDDYDFNQGMPPMPEDCAAEVEAGDPLPVYWVVAIADEYGDAQPAYLDQLGQYRAMAGDDWSDINGGDDERNPDMMIQYNQTAPFAAYGSLFAFNVAAIDNIRVGLDPLGDAAYYYDGTKPQITSGQRNDADDGVNRNNQVPTRIAGIIGVNIADPSDSAGDYVARPGPTASGFMLMDGSTPFGGEPVLDDQGMLIPVRMLGNDWYVLEPEDAEDPSSELVEAFLINEDQSPNRITFSEIQEAGTSIFELVVRAEVVLNLKLTLSVSDNANIPRITAELNIDWRTDAMKPPANPFAADDQQKRDLVPEVGVNNIRLDLGSFLTKFIKPVAVEVDKTLKPLDPLIDVLMASLPVLSDIAGRPIRLTTLLSTFGGPKGKAVATVIEMVVLVRQLMGVMAAVPNDVNVYLPIGNFWLAKVGAGPLGQPGVGTQIYYDNSEVTAPSITQRNQSMIANSGQALNSVTNALGKMDQMDRNSSSQPGVGAPDRGGFQVPILQDPMTVFKLLMGQDVPLVTFSLPKLDFTFNADIPLARIVILEIGLRFNVQMKGQLAIGYDTYGLRLFKDSGDPEDLLEGFYVSDRANADGTGADVDEFSLTATIALYGGVDLVLARAGIEGGFTFKASINLNDPNNDGKLRVMEAVELVSFTKNPLDLADLHFSGEIYARYYYWVGLRIWTPWKTYQITLHEGGKTFARLKVFSFTRDGRDGPPVVASMVSTVDQDGTKHDNSLLVHVGPNSGKRISNEDPLKLKDAAERVKIWNNPLVDPDKVYVQYLNYPIQHIKEFDGVSRVIIHGGEGNDEIDASGLSGIQVEFDGGAGNDTIYLGSGASVLDSLIKGGLGNDIITVTGGGRVRLDGDEGNDTITAGTGNATIDGGGGNDSITAGSGNNRVDFRKSFGKDNLVLNSAALVNLLSFIDSSLPVTAKLKEAASTIKAGETNIATFDFSKVTEIRGSDGRDTFEVTDPTTRSANGGKGVVLAGGPGDDTYTINANDVSAMNAEGITIDDDIEPLTNAVVGAAEVDDCGHIKKIKVTSPGLGYVQAPDVIITDPNGAGTGARAVANIDREGRVTGIYVLAKGDNYSANPTITLVRNISTGDRINFNSATQSTVAIDQQGNGAHDHQIRFGGSAFKWIGYEDQGTVRSITHDVNEIDRVSVTLPNAKLEINEAIDLQDAFIVNAKEFDQRAPITADTVKITTDRGFAADFPINATNNGDVVLRVTGKVDLNDVTTQARATATVVGGVITAVTITNGGSGYKFPPTITFDDARGAGARATTTLTNGVVTGITLISGGTGYLTVPAPKVQIAHPDSIQLNNNLSTSTVGSLPGDGDGRGTVTLRAEAGAINQSGDVFFPTGSQILWEHGDYRYTSNKKLDGITPAAYAATTGGSGATAQAVLDSDGRVVSINVVNGGTGYSRDFLPTVLIQGAATATAIVDNGAITGFKITYPGDGYAFAPEVKIISNGFGKIVGENATATALNRSHIKSAGGSLIAAAYSGIGNSSKPLKTDVENMVAQTFDNGSAIYVLEKDAVRIGLMDHINGVNTVNGDIGVTTFGGTISLGQPVQAMNSSGELLWQDANKTIPIYERDDNGKIIYKGGRLQAGDAEIKLTADDIDVNSFISASGGKLVMQPVQPDSAIGLNGTQARAKLAVTNGQITGVSELWSGRGYTSLPLVTIAPPGQRAFGVANVLNGQLQNINVTFGGTRYNAANLPRITLSGGGLNGGAPTTAAQATAIYNADGVVTGVTITNPGAGYYTAPTVNFDLPGIQATATAQVINGRISEVQIINPGKNYQGQPDVTISAPYAFSLEQEEVNYFQQGFDNITIGRADGRHTFHSANAGFVDGVVLRGPREGGTVEMENIRSSTGPVVIIGSGHTLNLTSQSPEVEGTFVEIDDNVVVHDGVDAIITGTDSYVSIFGGGKGKIDGVANSTSENLTITDETNILVTGAIGSTHPINDLTLTSNLGGTINLQQSVTLEGDLHITKGGDVQLTGNLVIGGDLIIDEATSVSFGGTVTVTGNIIIRKATTIAFAKNVAVSGDVAIGSSQHPEYIDGVNFASTARLDVGGVVEIYTTDDIVFGNRIGQGTAPQYITLRSDMGDVSFQASVNVPAGPVTIIKARDITFAQELTAQSVDIQDASGQTRFERASSIGTLNVISTALVQVKNRLDITSGSATLTTNDVDFAGGNGSINYTGNGVSTLTIRPRTLTRDITIGSPPGVFSSLDISDVDLAAIGASFNELAIGNANAGTGTVTLGSIGSQQGAGNSQLVTSTRIYGGTINVVQAIDSAAGTGYLQMIARTGNINVNARINGTADERNNSVDLQTLVGAININQPIFAVDELRLYSATTVTEGASGYVSVPRLAVLANGAITMTHASNNSSTVAMNSTDHAIDFRNDPAFLISSVGGVNGLTSGTANTKLVSNGGTVTQTHSVIAAGLLLQGSGGTFTLTDSANDIDTLAVDAQAVSFTDADDITVGTTGGKNGISTVGATTLVAGGGIALSRGITTTTGNISLDANGGSIIAGSNGDLVSGGSVTLDASDDLVLSDVTAATTFTATVGDSASLYGALNAGGAVAFTTDSDDITMASGASITAGDDVTLTSSRAILTQNITAAGDVTANAGTELTAEGAILTTASGNVSLVAQGGDVNMDAAASISAAGTTSIDASVDVAIDATQSAGTLTVEAGNKVDINDSLTTTAGNVAITATAASIGQVASSIISSAGTLGLAAGTAIVADRLIAGGHTTVNAGTFVTFNDNVSTASAKTLDVDAQNGAITMADGTAFTIGGAVDLDASQNIALEAISAGGNFSATAGTGITLDGALVTTNSGTVTIDANGADFVMASTASIDAAGATTITAHDELIADLIAAAGTVTLTGPDRVELNDDLTTTVGNVVITSSGGSVEQAAGKTLTSAGTVGITADGDILAKAIAAADDVTLTAGDGVTIADSISSTTGDLVVDANNGEILATNSVITIHGTVNLDASSNIALGTLTAGGNVAANAGDAMVLTNVLKSTAGTVTLDAADGDLTMNGLGAIEAFGATTLTATDDITTQDIAAGGALLVEAGNALNINATLGTTNDSTMTLTAQGGAITMASNAAIDSDGVLAMSASQAIIADDIAVSANASLTAGTRVQVNSAIVTTDTGTLAITAQGGDLTMATGSSITADGATTLIGSTTVTAREITVADDLTVTAGIMAMFERNVVTTDGGAIVINCTNGWVGQHQGASINSASTVDIDAYDAVSVTEVIAAGAVDVSAGGLIGIFHSISTTNGGTVKLNAGANVDMFADAFIDADGTVEIDAVTAAVIAQLTAADDVNIEAASVSLTNSITTTDGGTLTINADVADITMDANTFINADGATQLTAVTTITAQDVTAADDLTVTAGGSIASQGDLKTTGTGDMAITSTAGNFTQSGGTSITSARTVGINAVAVTLETVAAAGAVNVDASTTIALNEKIVTTAGGTVTLDAAGSFTMASDAEISAAAAVDIESGALATIQKLAAAGNVDIDAAAVLINESVTTTAGGTLSIDAAAGAITMADGTSINAAGVTTLTADTDITTETVSVAADLTVTAGEDISIDGNITTTNSGDVAIVADGNVTQAAGKKIDSARTVGINGAVITLETVHAAGLTTVHGSVVSLNEEIKTTSAGPIDIEASSGAFAMSSDARILSTGAIDIDANTDAVIQTIGSSGNVDIHAGLNVALNGGITTTSGATLKILADDGSFSMVPTAALNVAGTTDIDAGGAATLEAIRSGGNLTVDADAGISVRDLIETTAGSVSLASSDGTIQMQTGTEIISATTTTIDADQHAILTDVTSAGNVDVEAGQSVSLSGQIKTTDDGTVTLESLSAAIVMQTGSTIDSDSDVDLTAATTLTTTNIAAAGNVTATAGSLMTVKGTIGTTADGHVTLDVTNGALTMTPTAAIDASGDATLTASGAITTADIVADDEISIVGQSTVSVAGEINSQAGPVTVSAQGGALTVVEGNAINSGGPVTLNASTDISAEAITAAGKITIAAGDGVALNEAIVTTNGAMVAITADDGSIAMLSPASILSASDVVLTASDDISTLAITAAGEVTLTAGESASIGDDIAAGGTLMIETQGGDIAISDGATLASGVNVDLQSSGGIAADLIQAEGNIIINGNGIVGLNDNVVSTGGSISITSDNAAVITAPDAVLNADGTVTIDAGTALLLHRVNAAGLVVTAAGNATFADLITTTDNAASTVTVGGVLTIADAANIVADGSVTLNAAGGIVSAGDIITTADNVTINSPLTMADHVSISTGRRGAGSVVFAGTVNGAYGLTVRTGSDITVSGNVGQTTPLTSITILGARNVNLGSVISVGTIEQQGGSGTTTVAGTLAVSQPGGVSLNNLGVRVTGAIGSAAGATVDLKGTAVRITRTGRIWAGGKLSLTADDVTLENGSKAGVTSGADMVLTADKLQLGDRADAIGGTGLLVLQPLSVNTAVSIGKAGPAFDLTTEEIGAIAPGFKKIIVGRGQDADFDSGNAGNHAVSVETASFRAPVAIRATGNTGSITVNGTLTTQGRLSSLWLTAGADVAVHGTVALGRSGHIFITADADNDRKGIVRVAESTNATVTTPNGNILLIGPAVRAGGTKSWANIVSGNSSVFLGGTSVKSSVVITNPKTTISGKDVLVGGTTRFNPALISIEGNINVVEDLNLYSGGDIDLNNFRFVSEGKINVIADNDVRTNNGSLVGKNGPVAIRPDMDKDGNGTATPVGTRVSQPSSLNVRTRVNELQLPVKIVPGSSGDAFVVVGNNTANAVRGFVDVYVLASTDGALDATDRVIGYTRQRVGLQAGAATTLKIKVQIPANLPLGSYKVIAEAMPYQAVASTVGSNIFVGGTINVTAPTAA